MWEKALEALWLFLTNFNCDKSWNSTRRKFEKFPQFRFRFVRATGIFIPFSIYVHQATKRELFIHATTVSH